MVKVLGSWEPDWPAPAEGAGEDEATGVASAATEVAAGEEAAADEAGEEATADVAGAAVVLGTAGAVLLPAPVEGAGAEESEPAGHRAGPGMLYLMVAA